jgi:Phycobilisome Linker polypeptide/Domain of unknown function (DUF4214)
MYRAAAIVTCALFFPVVVSAQQPCTTDAQQVVNELYRHMLERQPDAASAGWVQQLERGRMTVRDVVRAIASSPEYTQRFIYPEAGESVPYERSVARFYRHILGRQPDPEGLRDYARLAQQSGPQAVVDRLVASREYGQRFGAWGVPGSGGLRFCPPTRRSLNSGRAEQLFRAMDRNNDGIISGEWQVSERLFAIDDWDGDGVSSADEIEIQPNGWIEAGEWSDTVTAFNRLDLNNDDRLFRQEFGVRVIERPIRTLPMTGQTVLVDAWERWIDTGIDVQARDLLLFEASGTIRVGDDARDVTTANGSGGHRTLDVPMLDQRAGALIGRIGHGPPFFVGSSRVVMAPTIGRLYLGVNADDFRDNVGSFEVTITIQ